MNAHAGVDVGSVVQAGHTFTNTDKIEKREDTLDKMTKQMDRSAQFSSLVITSLRRSSSDHSIDAARC